MAGPDVAILPRMFYHMHPQLLTPDRAVLAMFLMASAALGMDLDALAEITTAQALFLYACSNALALLLCIRRPQEVWLPGWVPVIGLLACMVLFWSVLGMSWLIAAAALLGSLIVLG